MEVCANVLNPNVSNSKAKFLGRPSCAFEASFWGGGCRERAGGAEGRRGRGSLGHRKHRTQGGGQDCRQGLTSTFFGLTAHNCSHNGFCFAVALSFLPYGSESVKKKRKSVGGGDRLHP